MAEKFSIFIGKDLEEIHRQYFCHACYAHPDRRSIVPVTWVTHYDDDCRVCSHVEEIRKVEGPRRYEGVENPDYLTRLQLFSLPVRSKILTLLPQTVPSTDSLWWYEFSERFFLPTNLKKELLCSACLQILDKPVETTCQHYFYVQCMKGVIDNGQRGSLPVCKENIGPLKVPTRMVLWLIAEQEVICVTCR